MRWILILVCAIAIGASGLLNEGSADAAPPPPPPTAIPVVIAPGAGNFIYLPPAPMGSDYLRERGYKVFIAPFGYNNLQNAYSLAATVRLAMATTGASKVHLVSISMGGIPAMYYQRVMGGDKFVDTWTGLDIATGPLAPGSDALLCLDLLFTGGEHWGHACSSSNYMKALMAGDPTPGSSFYTLIQWTRAIPNWDGACIGHPEDPEHLDPYYQPSTWRRLIQAFNHECPPN